MTSQASTMAFASAASAPPAARSEEQRFVIYGVPWQTYVKLRDALDDHSGLRMNYLEGTLELTSPSLDHADCKHLLARLLEAYAEERDIDLRGYGGATFRKEAKQRGLEPDECYSVGPIRDVPAIAIEVVVTSGVVDKLSIYEGLGVPEVWIYAGGQLSVRRLGDRGYELADRSAVLPELDLDHLARFVATGENQTQQVKAYRRSLRERGASASS